MSQCETGRTTEFWGNNGEDNNQWGSGHGRLDGKTNPVMAMVLNFLQNSAHNPHALHE
ncbi:hypothetical protein CORMATOL_01147 [Corynebacterium matruchotii ATCC 33806]|uniref:Uncharacterized protein n=2 Tax=Corynebacterium matruchotii TaxID=43768 RepID=E0DFP2_9CORY|nr:hypothetical protein CORMATOL_01147 [Corynebacterium matruchotii ATCC 33806]EFM48703.1 hypothetical protein HMPREF0299_6686 [Corynebacterium matruchotii ATCC 14266]